jgi:hypothetical protein
MTTKCGIIGIKNVKKAQNIEDKLYSPKSEETVDEYDSKNMKSKKKQE